MADELSGVEPDPPRDGVLPTGTVTFLFTDIEGSTRHLRGPAGVLRHRTLLTTAASFGPRSRTHGGHEVDTQGDSFFVAFPTPSEALAAAAQAQRSLSGPFLAGRAAASSCAWALHSGEAVVLGGGYLRSRRPPGCPHCCSCSPVARCWCPTRPPHFSPTTCPTTPPYAPSVSTDSRTSRSPHALFQLDVAGLPTRYPPLRTTEPAPSNPGLSWGDSWAGTLTSRRWQRC